MDKNSAKFFAAEIGAKIPTLDLHGFYPDQALEKLDVFIYQCVQDREETARIIYGGGTGKLRDSVLGALKKYPAIVDYQDVGGSCLLIIK
jgi:DNA-nicking Smr family endonuclease